MLKEEMLSELVEMLGIDQKNLDENKILEEFDAWDSIIIVSMIGMIGEHYDVSVRGCELEKCKTLKEIETLVARRQEESEAAACGVNS